MSCRVRSTSTSLPLRALLLASLSALPACKVILPEHSKSLDVDGHALRVSLLTWEDLEPELREDWTAAFGRDKVEREFDLVPAKDAMQIAVADVAGVAAVAIGFAIDWIGDRLEEESRLYEHEASAAKADDKFWRLKWTGEPKTRKAKCTQNYHAIRIFRTTKDTAKSLEIVYGICPSADESQFLIAPLRFELQTTPCKVLAWKAWTFLPPFVLALLFEDADEGVDVTVDLAVEASWVEVELKQDKPIRIDSKAEKIAHLVTTFPRVPLSKPTLWRAKEPPPGDDRWLKLDVPTQGWFGPVPISEFPIGEWSHAGNFRVVARVTDKDASNAAKLLTRARTELTSRKDDITALLQ